MPSAKVAKAIKILEEKVLNHLEDRITHTLNQSPDRVVKQGPELDSELLMEVRDYVVEALKLLKTT